MRSRLRLNRAVRRPSRTAVRAASQPAWPPPTTITSKCSLTGGCWDWSLRSFTPSGPRDRGCGGCLFFNLWAWDGLHLDGGGSTQMAWWNPVAGQAQVLNAPLRERYVGQSLGVGYW